jgi:hypothetical protein
MLSAGRSIEVAMRKRAHHQSNQGDTTMFINTKFALAAVLIIGSASAALANDRDGGEAGFVNWPSMDGVNPVYHPDYLGNAGKAYGYATSPIQEGNRLLTHKQIRDR